MFSAKSYCGNSTTWVRTCPGFSILCFSDSLVRIQRHPTTVFCKISVRRSKYCLQFSIAWIRLITSRCAFHSDTIFETCLKNSLRFCEVKFFIFYSLCKANFRVKRKPKMFGFKNVIEREVRKILTFVKHAIVPKIFGKITLKPS